MKIKIGIQKSTIYGDEVVYYVTAKVKKDKVYLFRMQPWYGRWRFVEFPGRSETIAEVPGAALPVDYFTNLCKAKYFLEAHCVEYPDEIEFYKGQHIFNRLTAQQ